ncbi:MAG TPA: hypothetical protein VH815_10230, partial [Acidobacteriota bacterium]
MIWGLPPQTFTSIHVVLSLMGIITGFVVMFGILTGNKLSGWTAVFLFSTIGACVTSLGFPVTQVLPSQISADVCLFVLTIAMLARYVYFFSGTWSSVYVISIAGSLYLSVSMLVV